MKKGVLWRRILSGVLSLAVIAYLAYQIYSVNHDVIQTEYALDYTYYQTVPLEGLFLRQEQVITTAEQGVVGYCQTSGSKVAAGHVVARVFDTDEQAAVQTQIDEINAILESLEGLQTDGTQLSANAEILDAHINQAINRMLTITEAGTTKGMDSVAKDLLRLLNKKQITLGTAGDLNAYLSSLKTEKEALEASVASSRPITTEVSGYFVNHVDGCEALLSYEQAAALTPDAVGQAIAAVTDRGTGIGKMISSDEWYLVSVVEQSGVQGLEPDDRVNITIPLLSDDVYQCTVEAVNIDYASGTAALILQCSQMNEQIADARLENAFLRTNTYNGLRVSASALRVVDGITGVYVVDGIAAAFKPVDILYSDADFAICKNDTANANRLKQYDEVILGGSDLYDGKIIR